MKKLAVATTALALLFVGSAFVRPSNSRHWIAGQERMPAAHFTGDSITIENVRNFEYRPNGDATEHWERRTYDLNKLQTVWFVLAPFDRERRGPAHTFLSFGFADSQFVSISVEARREVGEEYSLWRGLVRRYEIIYAIGDERDFIGLRANIRNDDVYVYPVRTTPAKARALLVRILEHANKLDEKPEFYNTLTNNCTTNILENVNAVSPHRIPYGREVLLPGYADELARRLDLIDSNLSLEQARARFLVNKRARQYANDPLFSLRIREAE